MLVRLLMLLVLPLLAVAVPPVAPSRWRLVVVEHVVVVNSGVLLVLAIRLSIPVRNHHHPQAHSSND